MLKRKLKDQQNLILWNGKYYVVNDLTFELLDMFDKNLTLNEIKKRTGYSKNELKIFNCLPSKEYCIIFLSL